MIVNAYAVLTAFVSLLQFAIGLLVITSSLGRRRVGTPVDVENRPYLLLLLSFLLLGLNLASWPLLYALLQSYVPSWPDVMCIYGVTRIGTGSVGSARHLPWLLSTVQCTKPLLVFLGGGWFVLYLANRATQTAPLLPRLLSGLLPLGVVSVADALCVGTYLAIPKQEQSLSVGCCTSAIADRSRFLPESLLGSGPHTWLTVALVIVVVGLGDFVLQARDQVVLQLAGFFQLAFAQGPFMGDAGAVELFLDLGDVGERAFFRFPL